VHDRQHISAHGTAFAAYPRVSNKQSFESTRTAFACWDDRVAPVFDTALQVRVVEVESGQVVRETMEPLAGDMPGEKVLRLAELRIDALVCGAISSPLHTMITAYGIRVVPFVAGDLPEVIQAWLSGNSYLNAFAMPGCCGRGRRHRGAQAGGKREEVLMNKGKRGRMGPGDSRSPGAGQGRNGGQGRGGGQGSGSGQGPGGTCLCPKCGHREPHERGVPCIRKQCPECGATMSRG
jgi:predicted Fe-Mo cluster-binding NifX family protein